VDGRVQRGENTKTYHFPLARGQPRRREKEGGKALIFSHRQEKSRHTLDATRGEKGGCNDGVYGSIRRGKGDILLSRAISILAREGTDGGSAWRFSEGKRPNSSVGGVVAKEGGNHRRAAVQGFTVESLIHSYLLQNGGGEKRFPNYLVAIEENHRGEKTTSPVFRV